MIVSEEDVTSLLCWTCGRIRLNSDFAPDFEVNLFPSEFVIINCVVMSYVNKQSYMKYDTIM